MKDLKVAIITEYISSIGGTDRVIDSLIRIFPNSHLYCATYSPSNYPNLKQKVVVNPFFDRLLKFGIGRRATVLFPYLFEQFDLRGYDIVISISAGPSKGVITSPDQIHIGIINTPPRHQWDGEVNVRGSLLKSLYKWVSRIVSTYVRLWDITSISRVDYIVTISKYIQRKIEKVYRKDSTVIYPGIKEFWFVKPDDNQVIDIKRKYSLPDEFVLFFSRLYDYKKADVAIEASVRSGENLVVVGDGPDRRYLERFARMIKKRLSSSSEVIFLGKLSDDEVKAVMHLSNALIFCGVEDFGLVPVEALATGTPVLGYRDGGLVETIENGRSGYHYDSVEELTNMIKTRVWRKLKPQWCIMRARLFTEDRFINKLKKYIVSVYERERV